MALFDTFRPPRRAFLGALGAALCTPALAQEEQEEEEDKLFTRNNVSGFKMAAWQDYFEDTRTGAILADLDARCVHFWSADRSIYRLYPCSVPLSEDLTRRGRTRVTYKAIAPDWRPTPSMRKRHPEWPPLIEGGTPGNPLGTHALYLSWRYYRIHGTHDTRKIGRRSSNGCIGLYNQHIEELFYLAEAGAEVLLI